MPAPRRSLSNRRVAPLLAVASAIVLLAGGGFAAFEDQTVSNYGEGLWWALSLMTTVGFVGESPETLGGRIISSVLMVSGFAMMAVVTAAISSIFVRENQLPDVVVEEEFEARALAVLTDIQSRLAALEQSDAQNQP